MKKRDSVNSCPTPPAGEGYVKRELLKATMRLLSELGREGATSRAICAEVGVSAPTMYHHYGDLAGLHKAAIDETYIQVAEAYRKGARERGALQGLRAGWATFNHFAREEPRMCRIVVQQIMEGNPPASIASTLRDVEVDLAQLHADGKLRYEPHFAVELLWMGTLGSVCYIASERKGSEKLYPALQTAMAETILESMFK